MGYKQLHGVQMIRCSSLSRVCLLYHCIQLGCLILTCAGQGKFIVMTPAFDILYESALHTDEFGEGNFNSSCRLA